MCICYWTKPHLHGKGDLNATLYTSLPQDGPAANCGNPLSKDYLHKMEDGTLSSAAGGDGQRILMLNSMVSFWRSARSRIM